MGESFFIDGSFWRQGEAKKIAFLVDAVEYFAALRVSLELAQKSILITGWNISARVRLNIEGPPVYLSDLLLQLVNERPNLHIYMLGWNFPFLLMPGRDLPPELNTHWKEHERIHHRIDDFHPIGACHHQKVVVIDSDIAFCGGLDICEERLDRGPHLAHDPIRIDSTGSPYTPFHDLQMMVQGPVAQHLSENVKRRWEISFEESPVNAGAVIKHEWPTTVPINLENIALHISLTYPYFGGQTERREVETLTVSSLLKAEKNIYIENQFLTAEKIVGALAKSLKQNEGPEIIVVLPRDPLNWLEWNTMGMLQYLQIKKLRRLDTHKRLGVFYPAIPDLGDEHFTVHSKLMIVDDAFLKLGSANFNNRSMGFDSECDLSFESENRKDAQLAIRTFRNRLFAEHLDLSLAEIEKATADSKSLLAFINSRAHLKRSLKPLDLKPSRFFRWLSWGRTFDPHTPLARERLLSDFLKSDQKTFPKNRPWALPLFIFTLLVSLSLFWLWREPYNLGTRNLSEKDFWIYFGLLFGLGGLLLFPPMLLILLALIAWGPQEGFFLGWSGLLITSSIQYLLGILFPSEKIREQLRLWRSLFFQQISRLKHLPNFFLRFIAMTPLMTLNVISGAARSSFVKFFAFNALTSLPSIIALSLFTYILEQVGKNFGRHGPSILLLLLALVFLMTFVRRGRKKLRLRYRKNL